MSDTLLDKLLDNDLTIAKSALIFAATTFTATKWGFDYLWASVIGLGVTVIDNVIEYFLDIDGFLGRKFWGEKKMAITFKQGEVIEPNISTTNTTADSPAKKYFNLEYPVKTTLSELENQISKNLREILELTDVLGTDSAPINPENIKAATHRIVSLAFQKRPLWFYLYDQKRVQDDSYHLEFSKNDTITDKVKYKWN